MFSEVDFRQELNTDEVVDSAYSRYHSTRVLVQVFTFLSFCGFLLALYFWINPGAFPESFSNAHPPRNNARVVRSPQQSQGEIIRANERFIMGMALVGLGIAYLVVFLKLMSRFHKNAALFKGSDLDISRKFFLFSWFIPIVSLYVPFRATDEILSLSQPRTRTEPATDRLLIAYWLSAFVTYLLLSVVIVNSISLGNVGPQFGGGPSLTFQIIDKGNSVAGLVLICLIIYRIDHYQRTRAKKGPEYDRPFACVSCGETVSISQGQCPMCGRKIPIGGAAEM